MSFPQNPEQKRRADIARIAPVEAWAYGINLADYSTKGREKVVAFLRAALVGLGHRAQAGHWAYCPIRHDALHRAFTAESLELAILVQEERAHVA